MEGKSLQIDDLRVVCERIFDFIQNDLKISSVELTQNFYWTVPESSRFDMRNAPTLEHVGSLVDDYEFVQSAVADNEQALPLLLQHVAPLLEMLSTSVRSHR